MLHHLVSFYQNNVVLHIPRLFMMYHNLYRQCFPSDFHQLSFIHIHFHSTASSKHLSGCRKITLCSILSKTLYDWSECMENIYEKLL